MENKIASVCVMHDPLSPVVKLGSPMQPLCRMRAMRDIGSPTGLRARPAKSSPPTSSNAGNTALVDSRHGLKDKSFGSPLFVRTSLFFRVDAAAVAESAGTVSPMDCHEQGLGLRAPGLELREVVSARAEGG